MRWIVGIAGVAFFVALGVAAVVMQASGPLVLLAVLGAFGVVIYLRHPETFAQEEVSERRGTSGLALTAWVLAISGLALCVISLLANIDLLLLVGVFTCFAAAAVAARAVDRRLPASVPRTWWDLGRSTFGRRPRDAE